MRSSFRVKARFVEREAVEPTWKAIHRAADANLNLIAAAFPTSIEFLRDNVNHAEVLVALQRNNPGTAIDAFPWDEWSALYGRLVTPRITETMRAGGESAGRVTVIQKQHTTLQGLFDMMNPRAQRIAAIIAASLVTNVSNATMQAMRDVIANAQQFGVSVRDQARSIERILIETAGLDARRAQTLIRFRDNQIARGVSSMIVRQRVDDLRNRMLMDRALVIARTETIDAANAGQVELWNQAREAGEIPFGMLKEWIATEDSRICPICESLDGQKVPLDQSFVDLNGVHHDRPTAHVMCRCSLALVEPEEEE